MWCRRWLIKGGFVKFQDGVEKEMVSRLITIVAFTSEVEEDIKVREVEMIPEVFEELG